MISSVTAAIEELWGSIRVLYPEIPDMPVFICIDSEMYGATNQNPDYLVITTLALDEGPRVVFDTVLHEAAHRLAWARGINDTHGSSFHNAQFATVAAVYFHMSVRFADPELGWSNTTSKYKIRKLFKREYKNIRKAMR